MARRAVTGGTNSAQAARRGPAHARGETGHPGRRRRHATAQDAQQGMSPMAAPPPPSSQAGSDQRPAEDTSSWRGTIDGWVKDQQIRRDALIAVGMLLIAAIIIVWIVFYSGHSALTSVLSTTIGKLILGGSAATIATGAGWKTLQRRRRRRQSALQPQLSTVPMTTNQDSSAESSAA
jgi:hypothetical protein